MTSTLRSTTDTRTAGSGVAVVLTAGTLAAVTGTRGVIPAVLLVAAWVLAGSVYAFALGHVAFVALLPDATLLQSGAVEVGLFATLIAPAVRDAPFRTVGAFAVASAGLIGVGAGVRDVTGELSLAAFAIVATAAFVGYGLHRYELVMLDLVEVDA